MITIDEVQKLNSKAKKALKNKQKAQAEKYIEQVTNYIRLRKFVSVDNIFSHVVSSNPEVQSIIMKAFRDAGFDVTIGHVQVESKKSTMARTKVFNQSVLRIDLNV